MYWFVSRNLKHGLFYTGKLDTLDQMCDQTEAVRWRKQMETLYPLASWKKLDISVYGKTVRLDFPIDEQAGTTPVVPPDQSVVLAETTTPQTTTTPVREDVTRELYDYIAQKTKFGKISDNVFWMRQVILQEVRAYRKIGSKVVVFAVPYDTASTPQDHDQNQQAGQNPPSDQGIYTETIVAQPISSLTPTTPTAPKKVSFVGKKNLTNDKEGTLVLMKERIDGYWMSPDILAVTNKEALEIYGKDNLSLSKTLKLPHPYSDSNPKYRDVTVTIPNNYTAAVRYGIFRELAKDTAKRMKRPYDDDTPLLFKWQYDVLKKKGKRTAFVHVRRAGKSVLMTLLALEGCMKTTHASAIRPTTVLYVGLSFNGLQPVINYLLKMKEALGDQGEALFHRDSQKNIFSFKQDKRTVWQIIFVSCESKNPAIGYFADLVILDEAAKIPQEVYEGIEPLVTHEGAELVCASTMYKDIRKSRFFDLLLEYEKTSYDYKYSQGINDSIVEWFDAKTKDPAFELDHYIGLRYTIDDAENIPETEKDSIKRKYEKDPVRYMTELYARFPDEGKVFKYEASTLAPEQIQQKAYHFVSVGFDPALSSDKSAVVVSGYNRAAKKISILEEHQINKTNKSDYAAQVPLLLQIIENVKNRYALDNAVFTTIDWTQRATAELFQIKGVPINLRVAYKDGFSITDTDVYNELRVPKRYLVQIAQSMFDSGKLRMNEQMPMLKKELDNFYEISKSIRTKFEWVGEHDDHVNAMMLSIFYLYEILNVKYDMNLDIKQSSPTWQVTVWDIKKYWDDMNLIKENEKIAQDNQDYRTNNVW